MVIARDVALLSACLSALSACSSDLPATTTAPHPASSQVSPTPSGPAAPVVAARLGATPSDCPGPHPRRDAVSRAYAPLVGAKPLWAGFYASYDKRRHAFTIRDAPRTKHGFRVKVLWVMAPRYEDSIGLLGENPRSRQPIRFHFEDLGTTTEPELSPELAGVNESRWQEFPSYLYFDRAGCFTLKARAAGRSWRIGFGFGSR